MGDDCTCGYGGSMVEAFDNLRDAMVAFGPLYLSLHTVEPARDRESTEVHGGSYARVDVTNGEEPITFACSSSQFGPLDQASPTKETDRE
jgi:hypothetical protein